MSLMPLLCPACRRVQLAAADAGRELPVCESCGSDTRLVPGCSFAAADRELFDELSHIAAHGGISIADAEAFALEAQRALWSGAYESFLERLGQRLPGLLPIQVAVGKNTAAQKRVISLLRAILDALTTLRTSPGSTS